MRRSPRPTRWFSDVVLASAFFVAAAVYLSLLPRNLGFSDESYFLYEAKRIRDGEVMYRDLFEFVTPLASYAMAGLYWLFGTSIATARNGMAVLHALTGVVLYATSRALGVRRHVAILVPLAHLTLSQTAWPYASWHWFSTFFTALLLLSMIAGPWASWPSWTVVPGLVAGTLICTQQQKGVVLTAGTVAILMIDVVLDRLYSDRRPVRDLVRRLGCFAAGAAAIVAPVMLPFVLMAGWNSIYDALVRFPLESYRGNFHTSWGAIVGGASAYTYPAILKYAPSALVAPLAGCTWCIFQRREREKARQLTVLIGLSGFSALSIAYFPDAIHLAFIAGVFWVAAATSLTWILGAIRPARLSHLTGVLVVVAVGSFLLHHLAHNVRVLRDGFPVSHQTAFGQVAFASHSEPVFFDTVRAMLDETPSRELFCYPELASPYLMTGGTNPTPYQYLLAGVSPDDHLQESLRIVEARQIPYIIGWVFAPRQTDPIGQYIRERYERVSISGLADRRSLYVLYRRKEGFSDDRSVGSGGASGRNDAPPEVSGWRPGKAAAYRR